FALNRLLDDMVGLVCLGNGLDGLIGNDMVWGFLGNIHVVLISSLAIGFRRLRRRFSWRSSGCLCCSSGFLRRSPYRRGVSLWYLSIDRGLRACSLGRFG